MGLNVPFVLMTLKNLNPGPAPACTHRHPACKPQRSCWSLTQQLPPSRVTGEHPPWLWPASSQPEPRASSPSLPFLCLPLAMPRVRVLHHSLLACCRHGPPPHLPSLPSRVTRAPCPGPDWIRSLPSPASPALTAKSRHLSTSFKTCRSGTQLCCFQEMLPNFSQATRTAQSPEPVGGTSCRHQIPLEGFSLQLSACQNPSSPEMPSQVLLESFGQNELFFPPAR